jgi:hypothetical protein
MRLISWSLILACPLSVVGFLSEARAETIVGSWQAPALDRWMYPFNATPGTRQTISTFGSDPTSPQFDSRDGQYIIAFDTAPIVPGGLGSENYSVLSAVLTVEFANDRIVAYDPTPDAWQTFRAPGDPAFLEDSDAGQPIELFGCGFRNGFSATNFVENSPYSTPPNPLASGVRNAFALSFDNAGTPIDVSNNPRVGFDPLRFATGQISDLAPGELIPLRAKMTFSVSLSQPQIQAYLRDGLNRGRVFFVVSSLTFVQQQGGNFPVFYAKENPLIQAGQARPASLTLTVQTGPTCDAADIDCDGSVGGTDLTILLSRWGTNGSNGTGDINGDGAVNGSDLTALLGAWTN